MATIRIRTPPPRDEPAGYTPRIDYVRGTAQDDVLHRPLTAREQRILEQLSALKVPAAEILDAIMLGGLRRELRAGEERALADLMDAPRKRKAAPEAETLTDALKILERDGSRRFDAGEEPNNAGFRGGDRIFGKGGDDYVADLRGDNLVSTEDGDDHILLGRGNDRIFDRGGNNTIHVLGGNNLITTRDGDDAITTGGGNDVINAFDGRNIIEADGGDNIVRGGNGFDSITVGAGDDLVEVRNGARGEAERFDLPDIGISGYRAHNFVYDLGGSDNIRATGSSKNKDSDVKDEIFNGNDLIISDAGLKHFGDDLIEAGGGHNIIVDFGGDNMVRTLEGDDIIFTSFVSLGDDDISAGAGDDIINSGAGADIIRGGPGSDLIFLENDGDQDRLVFLEDDIVGNPLLADVVLGFDGGLDLIDVSAFGLSVRNLIVFNAALFGLAIGEEDLVDLVIAWDVDRDKKIDGGDFFTTVLADFDEKTLRPSNFLFDADALV